jgi:hypothetical protein
MNPSLNGSFSADASIGSRGFALVIALGLMAFIVLLLLSITTFVRVEAQSSAIAIAQLKARENARLAAMQALGNLQKSMGPDQRISFQAAIFDADPSSAGLQSVENPLWLAAAPSVSPGAVSNPQQFAEVNREYALGFNTLNKLGSRSLPTSSQIQWLVSQPQSFSPSAPIEQTASQIAGSNNETIAIARRHSTFTDAGGPPITNEFVVEVGIVPVDESGGFAWWVEDEGLKAQFNLFDSDPAFADTALQQPLASNLYGIMQRRQSNFAHAPVGDPTFADLVNQGILPRLNNGAEMSLLSNAWADWITERSADIGFGSFGLPVDVVEGRLKQDLTVYLETGNGLDDNWDIIRGGSGDSAYSGTPVYLNNFSNMPKFGLLRGWHDLGRQAANTSVSGGVVANSGLTSRAQTEAQHGFHPQVWRTGVQIVAVVDGPLPDAVTGPQDVDVFLIVAPIVELWNPYSVPIPPEKYLIEISMPRSFRIGLSNSNTSVNLNTVLAEFDFLADGLLQADNGYAFGGNRGWVRMVIDTGDLLSGGQGIMPGESMVFSPFPEPSPPIYVNQPASAFNSASTDNYSVSQFLNPNQPFGFYRFPVVKRFELDPDETKYGSDIIPFANPDAGIYHRLSRLAASGPVLLSASDPLQTHPPRFIRQYAGQNPVDRFANTNAGNWNMANGEIFKNYHRVAFAAAVPEGAQHGGDRKIAHRNPRLGFLRSNLGASSWNDPAHVTQPFFQDAWSHYGPRWRIVNGPWDNEGSVDGYTHNDGSGNANRFLTGSVAAHYDFSRRYGPIHSLGQLMHANLNAVPFGPSYVVGYSRAPAAISNRQNIRETASTLIENERVDLAYMVNASLWDRFYLSTIPQTGVFDPADQGLVLANNQLRLVPSADGNYPTSTQIRNSQSAFNQSAANVLVEGAFNINSTSVEAWQSFLLSKSGRTLETAFGGNKGSFGATYNPSGDEEIVLFPRFAEPVFGKSNASSFQFGDPRSDAFYRAGLHITNRASIQRLAETIVAEIKRRGPFLSMADFVNRRLIPDQASLDGDYMGLMGTLEAAIHRVSQQSGLLNHQLIFGDNDPRGTSLGTANNADQERRFAVPRGTSESALEGYASYLMQADILASLGSSLSVRSDTFTIHGYGQTKDPVSGRIIAQARCELVVQRLADPVESGDSIINPSGDFGRRFAIVAFRWTQ